jgi:hypothetical protein
VNDKNNAETGPHPDRSPAMTDSLDPNWATTNHGETRIEVAWNPYYRRFEPIYPESEGYDEAERIEMVWCRAAGRYLTIPN